MYRLIRAMSRQEIEVYCKNACLPVGLVCGRCYVISSRPVTLIAKPMSTKALTCNHWYVLKYLFVAVERTVRAAQKAY